MASRDKAKIIQNKREIRDERKKKQKLRASMRWGALGVLGLVVVGFLVWLGTRPVTAMGDEVTVGSYNHVPTGSDPGPYASNPPAGGRHYPETYQEGFYEEADLESLSKFYEGYLVHNLEHGYVIFWYNCAADPGLDCEELKSSIRRVMDEYQNDEVIGFPWPSQSEPLVMTSWGRIMRFNEIDLDKMRDFVRLNRNQSPEADAN
jgi:hypothetical protein